MNLHEELLALAGESLTKWPEAKPLLADELRHAACAGRGFYLIQTMTLEAERSLLAWASAEGLSAKPTQSGLGSRLVLIEWGYGPIFIGTCDAMINADGSFHVVDKARPQD